MNNPQNQNPSQQKQDPKYAGDASDANRNKQAQTAWGEKNKNENEDESDNTRKAGSQPNR